MNVVFIEEADREYSDASLYYESQEPGLGKTFEEEVEWAIRWLVENPSSFTIASRHLPAAKPTHFPYYIPFVVRSSTLWVIAVSHQRRRPEYWITRTEEIA